jgi:putative ABC transport system permease protein
VSVDALFQDLRYAARSVVRARGFAVGATLALALGIGATTALFSVVWAVLLKPLPYHAPDRLVVILHGDDVNNPVSPADYLDLRRTARSFSGMAAAQAWSANLSAGGRTERIPALQVSPRLFHVVGVGPLMGRALHGSDDDGADSHQVVISHAIWTLRFGADRAIVGRSIQLNGEPYTIVGVMPETFRFAPFWQTQAELWVPLDLSSRRADRAGRSLRLFARLADGVTLDAARAEVRVLNDRLARLHPDTNRGLTAGVALLAEKSERRVRPMILATFAMAATVLLIACANVSTMNLARAIGRSRELAVRVALGAGGARLARLLLAEGLLIGAVGASIGLAIAVVAMKTLVRFLPPDALPPHAAITIAWPVALFAMASAVGCGIVTTVAPVLQARLRGPGEALRSEGRASTSSRSSRTLRQTMVGIEVALAFTLLASAGLLARTLLAMRDIDPGFRTHGAAAMSVSTDGTSSSSPSERVRFFTAVLDRAAALPGVTAAGTINHLPLVGDVWTFGFRIEGRPAPDQGNEPRAVYRVASPGYFRAIAQPLLAGRGFDARDTAAGLPVAIVNKSLAARWWPNGDVLGARLAFTSSGGGAPIYLTIVGIVGNVRQSELTSEAADEIYVPLAQRPGDDPSRSAMTIVVRTTSEPGALLPMLRNAVWAVDRQAAVYEGITLDDVLDREVWRERLATDLVGAFALVALILTAVGIHGILAYTVSQRTREFGLRLALGASTRSVRALASREAGLPVMMGLVAGLLLALASGRALQHLLVGTQPIDPWVLMATIALLVLTAGAAGWRPATRASRIDPAVALRSD